MKKQTACKIIPQHKIYIYIYIPTDEKELERDPKICKKEKEKIIFKNSKEREDVQKGKQKKENSSDT
jgi:hypothetical protein